MLLSFGTNAWPFTKQPNVRAPVCVAGGKRDSWSAGFMTCFLHDELNMIKLKTGSAIDLGSFIG
jgi:hypothetical protein